MFYGHSQPGGEELKPREVGSRPADIPRRHRAEPEGLSRPSSAAAASNPEVTLPSRARALRIVTLHRSVGSMLQSRRKEPGRCPLSFPDPAFCSHAVHDCPGPVGLMQGPGSPEPTCASPSATHSPARHALSSLALLTPLLPGTVPSPSPLSPRPARGHLDSRVTNTPTAAQLGSSQSCQGDTALLEADMCWVQYRDRQVDAEGS